MDEYISREVALNLIKELYAEAESPEAAEDLFEAHERIADRPTADVKPVVLCKDCKHYNDGWCYNPNTYDDEKTRGNTVPDWYCADGERRE